MAGDVLAELVHHPDRTTEEVIEEYLKDRRSDIPDKRVQEIIVQMRFIDSYATSFFREQAVRILVENGIRDPSVYERCQNCVEHDDLV